MSNNSDYSKPRTNLFNLLPEVYQSDTNRSVFENLFNRFLTKQETEKVAGYIGEGNPSAVIKRQIQEPTVHRQAEQLQPILYNKIGSVEHISSWKDILNTLERLGVDVERLPVWNNHLQFNWVPPIDIDKLIHYRDYYWFDKDQPNSRPQYITIRSRCATTTAMLNFWEDLMDEYGSTISILDIRRSDDPAPSYGVINISATGNVVRVSGDVSADLLIDQYFDIVDTTINNGTYQVSATPSYDSLNNWTDIPVVVGTLISDEVGVGSLNIRYFDKIVLAGEYTRLFEPGFVLYIKNSSNIELNTSFWTVVSSEFDDSSNETIIQINTHVSDSDSTGIVSLEEKHQILAANRSCQCDGSVGWDVFQWDDNPEDPLWEGEHTTLLASITHTTPPSLPGTEGQPWYDETNDILYQYSSDTDWKLLFINFSFILEDTQGIALWDETPGCGIQSIVPAADQWIDQNKWLHKSDIENFSIAKQAQFPIIEYDWDLELNEWTKTFYTWKYRADRFSGWSETTGSPSLIELIPIKLWEYDADEIVFDERYGDLTDWFIEGASFQAIGTVDIFEVEQSRYYASGPGLPYKTRIKITDTFALLPFSGDLITETNSTTPLRPSTTSQNDAWKEYSDHWLFVGVDYVSPINHQVENPLSEGTTWAADPLGRYEYQVSYYSQTYNLMDDNLTTLEFSDSTLSESTRSLRDRALVGFNDVNVYINEIRQYGIFNELTEVELGIGADTQYVAGIEFLAGYEPNIHDIVDIHIGEAAFSEFGLYSVPVRMIEDNLEFQASGTVTISLNTCHKTEQVKSDLNQYPLFDIYQTSGETAYMANPIFGFRTSPDSPVSIAVGQRIVYEGQNFEFEQYLVEEDSGTMYAYRDYSNNQNDLYFNTSTNELNIWTGLTWSLKSDVDGNYRGVVVSNMSPEEDDIDGLYWYDTINEQLKTRNVVLGEWELVEDVDYSTYDNTLQVIWKKGLNDEEYIPEKIDWDGRSLSEYEEQQDLFVQERSEEILRVNPSMDTLVAENQAHGEWLERQSNPHSISGAWVGDWEIPDPLYYNHLHENKKVLTICELLSHFNSIIQAQPKIPGFNGPLESMFHLIPTDEVNYGLGGKIREYNDSFDSFLSSMFVNNITPQTLIEFAHDQYESQLNSLKESFRKDAVELMLTDTDDAHVSFVDFASDYIITNLEQSDLYSMLYGDSTTFTDNIGEPDVGVQNWIATLPYLALVDAHSPANLIDDDGSSYVIHHDGHRGEYAFESNVLANIVNMVVNTPDDRTRYPSPANPPIDTHGRTSVDPPPNNITEFASLFNTSVINREGVYWNYVQGSDRTLYQLSVADIGVVEPYSSFPDGTLWLDMTPTLEVLRIKVTDEFTSVVDWEVVDGLIPGDGRLHNGTDPSDFTTAEISAWKFLDLNAVISAAVYKIEQQLYDNVPEFTDIAFDFDSLQQTSADRELYQQYTEEAFLNHVRQSEISTPYINDEYSQTDAFTWNYKVSVMGTSFIIVETDGTSNSFIVAGDHVGSFDPCTSIGMCPSQVNFYVKNSGSNDGIWSTIQSTLIMPAAVYNAVDDTTTIFVTESVTDSIDVGIAYKGTLPSSVNTGAESGGDWRDLFEKFYGTPYPNIEPWKLQNYIDKPVWWDEEYLNDDSSKWGIRRWKYKHGFEIIAVNVATDTFSLSGDFTDVFVNGSTFSVDSSVGVHDGGYNVTASVYEDISNTTTIQVIEDITSPIISGRITKAVGMWENIRIGVIPADATYSNGIVSVTGNPLTDTSVYGLPELTIPTYNYFSVNIDNEYVSSDGGTTKFESDHVLPPYWDYTGHYGVSVPIFDRSIRSLFSSYSSEINLPNLDFSFGDAGSVEWEWRTSSQFLYDQLTIAFRMQPVRFICDTFGFEFQTINGLDIDSRTNNTPCHNRTNFHGEIVDNSLYKVDGINQWYVNYNRYSGFDTNFSNFKQLWSNWVAPLSYQFAAFIDTPLLQLSHKIVYMSEFDYNVTSKRSTAADDYWLDAFDVSVLKFPPTIARYDNQNEWRFEVDTNSPLNRSIEYYDVHNYQFYADPDTNVCKLYTYPISTVDYFNSTFTIQGNHTDLFINGSVFDVTNSTNNDGTYDVFSSAYDALTDTTVVDTSGMTSIIADGVLSLQYRTLPWQTGEMVHLSTFETLPAPLMETAAYFIIVLNDTEFQLAETEQQAIDGMVMDIAVSGRNDSFVGKLTSTFTALSGIHTNNIWRHYEVDATNLLRFTPPNTISGVQSIINMVDGYNLFVTNQGWAFNVDKELRDPLTSRFVDWQVELERFIDFIYKSRTVRNQIADKYKVVVNKVTDIWKFVKEQPNFITGEPVIVYSHNNVYPEPLIRNVQYYIIRDSLTDFRLAATKRDAELGNEIDITQVTGISDLSIMGAVTPLATRPTVEINPFRNAVWFRPEHGVVSNLLTGPSEDLRNQQLMFDQYGRPLTIDQIRIFREDKETKINVVDGIHNDIELTKIFDDPYNYIHLGGMHLFVDTYEHILMFNNYTSESALLYDPFLGLNVTKFELLFQRQQDFTRRPNMGGYYNQTFYNQGSEFKRNIEAGIEDLRYLYDTHTVFESTPMVKQSRAGLGYMGTREYLDNLNLNEKSQFLFWKGQIQYKGSTNAINAFINSRRFIDAKIDEFWALKIADFGSTKEKEYPEMYMTTVDARSNDLRLQFVNDSDICYPGYDINIYDQENCGFAYPESGEPVLVVDDGFTPIAVDDQTRWYEQPNQYDTLLDNGLSMYFDLKPVSSMSIDTSVPVDLTLRHNFSADLIKITLRWYSEGTRTPPMSIPGPEPRKYINIADGLLQYIPFTNGIKVFKNGDQLTNLVDYVETLNPGNLLAEELAFVEDLDPLDVIEVVYTTSTLLEGIHFENINTNIINFIFPELVSSTVSELQIWGLIVDKEAQNPITLVDKKAEAVVTPIPVWDPARDFHYYNAIHLVDLQNDDNPTIYNNTPKEQPSVILSGQTGPWNNTEVGTTWLDTTNVQYVPYYDGYALDNIDERLRLWGQLADWGDINTDGDFQLNIYEWVKSDVHPSEWNALAELEEGDTSIPETTRKSGRVEQTLFEWIVSSSEWVPLKHKYEEFDVAIEGTTYTSAIFAPGEVVNVYVNGRIILEDLVLDNSGGNGYKDLSLEAPFKPADRIRVVKLVPTDETFIEAEIEAGNLLREYEYSQIETFDDLGFASTEYYFWVNNQGIRRINRTMSADEASRQLVNIPSPYVFFQKVKEAETVIVGETQVQLPDRFVQAIIRGLRGLVDDDYRYVLRYTRDFSLRDSLEHGETSLQLKNLHEDWELFREAQQYHIKRYLWDKITESLVGYNLNDSTIRIPSYEYELYDSQYGTDTRYGLKDGQLFVDSQLALSTINADLESPDNDFYPVDINVFFNNHNFDTPEDIIDSMNTIYETFSFEHVNRMFFLVLHDAFSTKAKYPDIFKTSMIALHGVRPFQSGGVFDD